MRKVSRFALALAVCLCASVALGDWPSKSKFEAWAESRVQKYNGNARLVATCGKMTEIGSPRGGTIWVFGRWGCSADYLEAIAESVGVGFRSRFGDETVSVHVWDATSEKKLATKRFR